MSKVLTLTFAEGATEEIEVHVLNVGDRFPGFGGSRHDLIVKGGPSIVVRRYGGPADTLEDKEYGIADPEFWAWMGRLVAEPGTGITATAEEQPSQKAMDAARRYRDTIRPEARK